MGTKAKDQPVSGSKIESYARRNGRTLTQQLVMDALLAAMAVVLGFMSIRIGNVMKISLEDFPIMIAALIFGPVDGMIVAGIGIFLYQLISYGITATTALWILPFVIVGAIAGLYAKRSNYNNNPKQIFMIFLICEVLICLLNIVPIYVDSKIYGYYYPTIITGMIAIRLAVAVGKGAVLGLVSPPILKALSRVTGNGRTGSMKTLKTSEAENPVAESEVGTAEKNEL